MEGISVSYLQRHQIDAIKWDRCVVNSANALIYAHSMYLDAMADNWNGIVVNDYAAVMPLPWRKKWGIRYYYHPPFIQQLGVFGQTSPEQEKAILEKLSRKARYGDILLNFDNMGLSELTGATPLTNLVIDLSAGYEDIRASYKTDLINNLKKAAKQDLHYSYDDNIVGAIALFKARYGKRMPHVRIEAFQKFSRLSQELLTKKMAIARKVTDKNGGILSVALLLKDSNRIYNMMNTNTEEGREKEANPFLIDHIIREFAGNPLLLDMEGSDLEGVKSFYRKFGARDQPYYLFKYNNLPFFVRLLKK